MQALPQTSHAWEPRQDMSSLVMGSGAAENGYSVIWSPQIASDDNKFFTCVLKSGGYGTPQSKKWGVRVPLVRYAYASFHFQYSVFYVIQPPELLSVF